MKLKATSIICLLALIIASCQNDISNELPVNEDGTVPVKVSLSMLSGINYDTGYEPMTRADGLPKAYVSSTYGVLICKKIENRWVVEKFLRNQFPKNPMKIYDEDLTQSFTTDLRPGKYRMTVVTGISAMAFDKDLQPGKTVMIEGDKPPLAFTYLVQRDGFLNPDTQALGEEIFVGHTEFNVVKTEDLHTTSPNKNIDIKLERKVTKLRVFLKKEHEGIGWIRTDNQPAVTALLKIRDNENVKFVNGLDIWGNIYYDESNPFTSMSYGVFIPNSYATSLVDGQEYMVPGLFTRQFNIFFFSDPDNHYPIEISEINISYANNQPEHAYADPVNGANHEPIPITLKHNTQHGIAFAPGGYLGKVGVEIYDMILLKDADDNLDQAGLFPLTFEYR